MQRVHGAISRKICPAISPPLLLHPHAYIYWYMYGVLRTFMYLSKACFRPQVQSAEYCTVDMSLPNVGGGSSGGACTGTVHIST